jgi:hypothetical protein
MTAQQILAIKCAYLDLVGAVQNYENQTYAEHDWKAHKTTIEELEQNFEFLTLNNENNQAKDKNTDNTG